MNKLSSFVFGLLIIINFFVIKTAFCDSLKDIHEEAVKMSDAFLKKDYPAFASYIYPLVLEKMGGAQEMAKLLEQAQSQMDNDGIFFDSIETAEAGKIVEAGGKSFSLVPRTTKIHVPNGFVTVQGYLLAISNDGKKWYFVDTDTLDEQKMAMFLPEAVGKIIIPPKTEPVFTENK